MEKTIYKQLLNLHDIKNLDFYHMVIYSIDLNSLKINLIFTLSPL